MKARILLIIPLHFFATAFSQTEILGTVTDQNGQPVFLANVSIEGTYDGNSTGPVGKFAFTTTENGSVQLLVSLIGFKTFNQSDHRGSSSSF